jgi:Fur family transcriptional regulator, iron response regulator
LHTVDEPRHAGRRGVAPAPLDAYDLIHDNPGADAPGRWALLVMAQHRATVYASTVPAAAGAARPGGSMRGELNGCPWHDVRTMLRRVGLRPTRQRMSLGWILFAKGDRHVTAELLYDEATRAKVPVSLATVYNTLHQFTEVGLLRQVAVDGSKSYFDTNASEHHHFFVEGEDALVDIPGAQVLLDKLPTAPEGYEIARVDVVVRLRRKG